MDPSPVVLVVDDEEVVRQVVKGALLDLGHTVDLAADGAEALRCLAHRKYDVILTDLQMPQMDGLTLFRRATEAGHPGAWILMTGSARPEVELSVPLLSKPFLLDELESVFKRVVSRGTTPGVP
ncbi:MAG: response regulator [Myxococcales bacterium]|nr:response regulator [Myxococcales bacterium]